MVPLFHNSAYQMTFPTYSFLFIGASTTYADAVEFCQEMGAFLPILQNNDPNQAELAYRIDKLGQSSVTETERTNSFGVDSTNYSYMTFKFRKNIIFLL